MLNGYPESSGGKDKKVVPSCYSFSKLQNAFEGMFSFTSSIVVGFFGALFGIPWTAIEGPIGLSLLLPTIIYVLCMEGLKAKRGARFGRRQLEAEELYNSMPKKKRKEYKDYLVAAYRSDIAAKEASDLFWHFQVDQPDDIVRKNLTKELEQVKEAAKREEQIRREAEKIYKQSLKEVK